MTNHDNHLFSGRTLRICRPIGGAIRSCCNLSPNASMSERARLDSWKEIARYLGRDVRTVLRWERRRGLPVYRVPGGKLPRVFAYRDELDRWLEGPGISEVPASAAPPVLQERDGDSPALPPQPVLTIPLPNDSARVSLTTSARWRFAASTLFAATLLAAAAAGLWAWTRPPVPLARLVAAGNELQGIDAMGATRWTHRDASAALAVLASKIADTDGDGRDEALASIELTDSSGAHRGGVLTAFDAGGRVRWSYAADDRILFRDGTYGPPWAAAELSVYRTGGRTRIAWAVHHFTWWPSLLLTFDASGNRLGMFVNSGWIRGASPSADGRFLLATGVANSWQAYFVAVLDADNPTGHSPEPAGSPMECLKCPAGDPVAYYVLPRTDVSRHHTFPSFGPSVMTFRDGTLQVHSPQNDGPTVAAVIYEFATDLTLRQARFADSFWEWHRLLEADGKLDHPADRCPERQGLQVQLWTRTAGWQTINVPVR